MLTAPVDVTVKFGFVDGHDIARGGRRASRSWLWKPLDAVVVTVPEVGALWAIVGRPRWALDKANKGERGC